MVPEDPRVGHLPRPRHRGDPCSHDTAGVRTPRRSVDVLRPRAACPRSLPDPHQDVVHDGMARARRRQRCLAVRCRWWIAASDPELSSVALTFPGPPHRLRGDAVLLLVRADVAARAPSFASGFPACVSSPSSSSRGAIALVTGLAIVCWPLRVPARIGTVAVVLLGAMLFAGFAALAVAYAERTRPPKIVAAFRLKRTPVFVFMACMGGAGWYRSDRGQQRCRRSGPPRGTSPGDVTIDDVWDRWVGHNADGPRRRRRSRSCSSRVRAAASVRQHGRPT